MLRSCGRTCNVLINSNGICQQSQVHSRQFLHGLRACLFTRIMIPEKLEDGQAASKMVVAITPSRCPISTLLPMRRQWTGISRARFSLGGTGKSPCFGNEIESVGSHFLILGTPHTGQLRILSLVHIITNRDRATSKRYRYPHLRHIDFVWSSEESTRSRACGGCPACITIAWGPAKSPHEPKRAQTSICLKASICQEPCNYPPAF